MLRSLLLLCLSALLYNATARPFKSWENEANKAAQDTRYDDLNEKTMSEVKEVESLLDLGLTQSDTDPGMLLKKAIKQFHQQRYNQPEEDKDDIYHAFESSVIKQTDIKMEEAEKDLVDVFHNTPELVDQLEIREVTWENVDVVKPDQINIYLSPEEDKDALYHGDLGHITDQEFEALIPVMEGQPKMVYKEPEVDLDSVFHS